jgi:hypothetical protein
MEFMGLWCYGIGIEGSESLGVGHCRESRGSRIAAGDILLPILPVKDYQINMASLIISARTLSIRRSGTLLRHPLIFALLLSLNENCGTPLNRRLLPDWDRMFFVIPAFSQQSPQKNTHTLEEAGCASSSMRRNDYLQVSHWLSR